MKQKTIILLVIIIILSACKKGDPYLDKENEFQETVPPKKSKYEKIRKDHSTSGVADTLPFTFHDTLFVNLRHFSADFEYDLKYATEENFLGEVIYDCPECYLRLMTVKALMAANKEFMDMGYRIKLFDCYRPLDAQKKMWALMPGTNYVANPNKGSVHNRGGAIDLTLVDAEGQELNMGTPFDHFGIEAHHDYQKLPDIVLKNRRMLKTVMRKHGFSAINSEWWHYNYLSARNETISNFQWECP